MPERVLDTTTHVVERALYRFADQPVRIAVIMAFAGVFGGGTLYSWFEADTSIIDGWYWATVVMPTVGFGDFSPATTLGRSVYQFVWASGKLAEFLLIGALSSAILQAKMKRAHDAGADTPELDDDLEHLIMELRSTTDHVCDHLERLKQVDDDEGVRAALARMHQQTQGRQ